MSEADANASGELIFDTIDRPFMTTSTLDRYVRLSDQATATLRGKAEMFLGCSSTMDATCVRTGLQKLARRAFKRAPTPEELTGLMAIRDIGIAAAPMDQGETGTLAALQALLLAPATLYRTEFSAPATGMTRMLTPHERAAAIAALLLDSVPDEALLAAADDGSIGTDAGVAAQVDRLLALPRVRSHLTDAILTAYNVSRVFTTQKDEMLFPADTSELQNSMYQETRRFVDDALWTRKAPIGELLTSKRSFIDANLAKLDGLPAPRMAFEQTTCPRAAPVC